VKNEKQNETPKKKEGKKGDKKRYTQNSKDKMRRGMIHA
jgi:hypothetical protein